MTTSTPARILNSGRWSFPCDDWGVPILSLEMQPLKIPQPWDAWNSLKRNASTGCWHFYEWDHKFYPIIDNPDRVLKGDPGAIVECNFSTDIDSPKAYLMGLVYTKRWLARTWQSFGLPVFVDVFFAAEQADILLRGVPKGYRAYATRGTTDCWRYNLDQYEMACERAGDRNIFFVVVGGGKAIREKAEKKGMIWVPDFKQRQFGQTGE